MKTQIFWITGGIGKVIASTVIVSLLKQKNPGGKLIVITPHPQVLKNNPNIDELYDMEGSNMVYQKYLGENTEILSQEPYNDPLFISGKESLLETWARIYGLELKNSTPQLFYGAGELEKYNKIFQKGNKPIFVIHPFGGGGEGYNWARDIHPHMAQQIVNAALDNYVVYQIKGKNQPLLTGAIPAEQNIRKIASLLKLSSKRLLIDSFSQHLASSLSLKSIVCWYTTSPKSFGYPCHSNLVIDKDVNKPIRPFYYSTPQGLNFTEPIELCPYENPEELHPFDNILKEINR